MKTEDFSARKRTCQSASDGNKRSAFALRIFSLSASLIGEYSILPR